MKEQYNGEYLPLIIKMAYFETVKGGTVFAAVLLIIASPFILVPSDAYASTGKEQDFQSILVQVQGDRYPVYHRLSNGGSINDISTVPGYMTVRVNVTSHSNGSMELVFPRELYDRINFTEHYEPVLFVNTLPAELSGFSQTCGNTSMHIPLKAGDNLVEIINTDILIEHTHSYPQKISLSHTISEQGQNYTFTYITDAKKCDVSLSKEQNKLHFDIKGRNEDAASRVDVGYFRVFLPHDLLGGNYTVLVDGQRVSFTEQINSFSGAENIDIQAAEQNEFTPLKRSDIVFSYPKDATSIDIIGTTAVPEFGSLVLVVAASSVASVMILLSHSKLQREQ